MKVKLETLKLMYDVASTAREVLDSDDVHVSFDENSNKISMKLTKGGEKLIFIFNVKYNALERLSYKTPSGLFNDEVERTLFERFRDYFDPGSGINTQRVLEMVDGHCITPSE